MARFKKIKRSAGPGAKKKSVCRPRSYTPISDALSKPFTFADTELSEGIKRRTDAEPLQPTYRVCPSVWRCASRFLDGAPG
jgi:hypothetical protein